MSGPAIVARGLTRRFGKLVAVDGVDLDIPRARIYGFLGPNGSGKSTTIRMLCGLLRPSAGTVAGARSRDAARRRAAARAPRIHDAEILALGRPHRARKSRVHGPHFRARRALRGRKRIANAGTEFDLARLFSQRAGTLSGGQRQRLALAAATLHEPELLLLDEPTSAVDPQSRRDFWESLFALVARGVTILVSTHYMDEAERCHELAILADGKLVAQGTPQRLMADIPATVIEVDAADTATARRVCSRTPAVLSIAQLGTRLHVLLDRGTARTPKRASPQFLARKRRCACNARCAESRGCLRVGDGIQSCAAREHGRLTTRVRLGRSAYSRSC